MKKLNCGIRSMSFMFFLTAFMVFAISGQATAKNIYKWRAQSINVEKANETIILKHFSKTVREISGGRIQITVYPAPAIVPPSEVVQAIGKGILQTGTVAPAVQADTAGKKASPAWT